MGRLPTFCFSGSFTQLIDRFRAIAERVAGSYGLAIHDVQYRRESSGWVLRIFLDVPDTDEMPAAADASVTVDDCANVSRDVSAILDVEEAIDHHFILEVSSPGLDRPLKSAADFRRFRGEQVEVTLKEPFKGRKRFRGELMAAETGWRLVLAPTAAVAAAKKHAASRSAQARAAAAGTPAAPAPAAGEEKVLSFTLDEVKDARLVPVIDFKGRRFAPPDAPVQGARAGEEADGGRTQ